VVILVMVMMVVVVVVVLYCLYPLYKQYKLVTYKQLFIRNFINYSMTKTSG